MRTGLPKTRERVREPRRRRRRTAQIAEMLKAVAVAANEADDVATAMRNAIEAVCAHTGSPVGHLFLCSPEQEAAVPTRVWYLAHPTRFEAFQRETEALRIPPGDGLLARVLHSQRAEWIRDVSAEPAFKRARVARASGLRSAFAVPVLVAGEVTALLEFFTTDVEDPAADFLAAVPFIGAQLGRLVERVRNRDAMEQAAEKLRESEERYRAVVSNIPGVAWVGDHDGKLIYISPRVEHVTGFSPEEFYGLDAEESWQRIHPDDRSRVIDAYAALFGERAPFDLEYRILRKEGRWIWIRARGELIAGSLYASGVFEDVTERRLAAQVRALLFKQALTAQEEERKRIARELHDDTAQALVSLRMGLERLQEARSVDAAREEARVLRDVATDTLREIRRLSAGLRPGTLDDLGLAVALERFASDFGTARGLVVEVDVANAGSGRLAPEIEIALYRIAQEALANVARHAGATRVSLVLRRAADAVTLTIADNGTGFDVDAALAAAAANGRFGLHNIRERADVLGGQARMSSTPGAGAEIVVEIPVSGDAP